MIFGTIFSTLDLQSPATLQKKSIGTYAGQSIKITNNTKYELDLFLGDTQIDAIPPYTFVIMDNMSGLYCGLNLFTQSPVSLMGQYASFTTIDGPAYYQMGPTSQVVQNSQPAQTITWQTYAQLSWQVLSQGYRTWNGATGA